MATRQGALVPADHGQVGRAILASLALACASIYATGAASPADAQEVSFLDTQLKMRIIVQGNPRSELSVVSFPASAIVAPDRVEFPDVESLFNPDAPRPPNISGAANISIDAGKDFIELDFDNTSQFEQFAPAYQNTYVFTFDSAVPVEILHAQIDDRVTTLGLTPERVAFANNELYINVEGLRYDRSTFARINLVSRAADPRRPRRQVALPVSRTRERVPTARGPSPNSTFPFGIDVPGLRVDGPGAVEDLIRGGAGDLIGDLLGGNRPVPRTIPRAPMRPVSPHAQAPSCGSSPEAAAECVKREAEDAAEEAGRPVLPD